MEIPEVTTTSVDSGTEPAASLRKRLRETTVPCVTLRDDGVVEYPGLRCDRPTGANTSEELARGLLVAHLVDRLRYDANHLVLEFKLDARIGRSSGPFWVDIAILDEGGKPWCLMEVKSPDAFDRELNSAWEGQLFGVAGLCEQRPSCLVYATIAPDTGDPRLEVVDAHAHASFEAWNEAGRPAVHALAADYGRPQEATFANVTAATETKVPLRSDVGAQELSQLRTSLHDVLWGGGAQSDSDIFNLLTRLILVKTHDECSTNPDDPYEFQSRRGETIHDTLQRLDALFHTAMKSRFHIETDEPVRQRDKGTDAQIEFAVAKLAPYNLREIAATEHGEGLLGDFFEQIMRGGFKQSKGQFFTHRNVVKFMCDVVDVGGMAAERVTTGDAPPTVIDPSAGSGAFLVTAMRQMTSAVRALPDGGSHDTSAQKQRITSSMPVNKWAESHVVGLEINPDLGLAAQVNMLLHGDGSSSVFAGPIYGDGLAEFSSYPANASQLHPSMVELSDYQRRVCEQFDVVLTNPPFSADITDAEHKRYQQTFDSANKKNKQGKVKKPQTEHLFTERWFQLLKPGGRLAAVVPNSLLDARTESVGREFLIKYFWIRAIVSLPSNTFYPHTSTKTSIVFAEKKTSDQLCDQRLALPAADLRHHILVHEPSALGYRRTQKSETPIDRNDLVEIAEDLRNANIWQLPPPRNQHHLRANPTNAPQPRLSQKQHHQRTKRMLGSMPASCCGNDGVRTQTTPCRSQISWISDGSSGYRRIRMASGSSKLETSTAPDAARQSGCRPT